MLRHGIALVLLETVARAILRQRAHQPVARHLGDDRRRRDRQHQPVAADHGVAVAGVSSLSRPSTNTCFGISGSALHRARQRPQRGAQDIVAIDPRRRREGDRERRGGADFLEQFLAALGRQPLGIVDALRNPLGIEHHGGGHHRARQRTAAGLVAAGHRPDAALDQRALAPKARRRDRDHALRQLGSRFVFFGFLANHAGMVRKRARRRNREPGAIPVIQPDRVACIARRDPYRVLVVGSVRRRSQPWHGYGPVARLADDDGERPKTNSTAARCASASRNDRWSVSSAAC